MTAAQIAKQKTRPPFYTSTASLTRPATTPTYTANDVVGGPSSAVTFTSDVAGTLATWAAAHGAVTGDAVIFRTTGGTIAAGLTSEVVYYAVIPIADPTTTMNLAATYAGAVAAVPVLVGTTGTGSGTTVGSKVGSSILVFPNMGDGGNNIEIKHSILTLNIDAVPANMAGMRLHLYGQSPSSLLNDDNAWALSAADLGHYLGYIDLGTPVDCGPALIVQATNIGKFLSAPTSTLYGYLATVGNYAGAASTVATIKLFAVAA